MASRATTDPESLPDIETVRTQATVRGQSAVIVRFATGARLRYVTTSDGVSEEWLPPDGERPARTSHRSDVEPATAALRAVGEYLSFTDRQRAEFVWGSENVAVVLDE